MGNFSLYYCAPNMEYIDEAREIKIDYRPTDETLEEFITMDTDRMVTINLPNKDFLTSLEQMNFFKNLKQKNIKNYILMFPLEWILTKDKKVDNIKFAAIKDCATNYCFSDAIGNWEILQFVLSLGVSDVIVTDMLGFNMERVRAVCGNTRIRVTVNIAQSAWVDSTDVTKFFIRPEDIPFYDKYIDVFEFQGDKNHQEILYKVYSKQKYWYGDLREIIVGLNTEVDSRRLVSIFGEVRANCGKRCITGKNCQICKRSIETIKTLEKANLAIDPITREN